MASSSADSEAAQQRKDTTRLMHTMLPSMPPSLVSFCVSFYHGPEKATPEKGKLVRRAASRTPSKIETNRFKVRRMDSGPLGERSLTSPIASFQSDKRGFNSAMDQLAFDMVPDSKQPQQQSQP